MVSGFGGTTMEFIVCGDAPCRQEAGDQEVAKVKREATGIGPEELGLTLDDGKTVLKQVQARIVQIQIEAISAAAKATVRDLRVLAQVWCKRYAGLVP
jgi:hypothetical protein